MAERSTAIGQVLIVDGDDVARGLLARLLQAAQYDCVAVSSGQEALDCLPRRSFDVMLCDTGPKDMGIVRLLDQVKQQAPTTKIILIARSLKAPTFGQAIRTGAFDFLRRPLQACEVLARVQEARDSSRALVLSREARRRLSQALDRVTALRARATRMAGQLDRRDEPLWPPSGLARPFPKSRSELRRRRLNHLRRARVVSEKIRWRAERLTRLAPGCSSGVAGSGPPEPEATAPQAEVCHEVRG